jgi:hypothetical protein
VSDVDLSSRVTPAAHVQFRSEGDDGAILYDPETDRVAILNPTAASVWSLLDGVRTVSELVAALATEYEDMGPEAEAQVLRTVRGFVDRGAAVVVAAPGA